MATSLCACALTSAGAWAQMNPHAATTTELEAGCHVAMVAEAAKFDIFEGDDTHLPVEVIEGALPHCHDYLIWTAVLERAKADDVDEALRWMWVGMIRMSLLAVADRDQFYTWVTGMAPILEVAGAEVKRAYGPFPDPEIALRQIEPAFEWHAANPSRVVPPDRFPEANRAVLTDLRERLRASALPLDGTIQLPKAP